jgi:hypothetical protein
MENNNHQKTSYGNGFIFGLIVGVIITLLFTTKRGRIIFKEIMENGVRKFSDLEQILRESDAMEYDEEIEEGDDFIPAEPAAAPAPPVVRTEPVKPKVVKAEPKAPPPPPPAPKPTIEEDHAEAPEEPDQVEEESFIQKEEKALTKPKSTKRWFRGLRKKS